MRRILAALTFVCAATPAVAQCVTAGPAATSYGAGDDVVVNGGVGIDLGFAFPLGGAAYQFVHPSTNGYIHLTDGVPGGGSDYSPTIAELEAFGEPTICGAWYDWSPN